MILKKPHDINDKMFKYQTYKLSQLQHEYLELPGDFKALYPQEIINSKMEGGRADDIHSSTTGELINVEEESDNVTEETLRNKNSRYALFMASEYTMNIFLAIICHKDPKNFPKSIRPGQGIEFHFNYYYFPEEELLEKHENIINKVEQKEELTRREALDIAFIAKYIGYKKDPEITESLAYNFNKAIIKDKVLKRDIGILLAASVTKYITDKEKNKKLMEMINMGPFEDIFQYTFQEEIEEYESEIKKITDENKKITDENKKIKEQITQILSDETKPKKDMIKMLSALIKI